LTVYCLGDFMRIFKDHLLTPKPHWKPLLLIALGAAAGCGLSAKISQAQMKTSGPAATRIAIDEKEGSFTFISQGEPIARLDANGLHVVGDITYSGVTTDIAAETVKARLAGDREEEDVQ